MKQPERAADNGEHHAFGQELANQARTPGAERSPNRNLALADRRAREQQVRHVCTGDEQDEADRGEQRQQRRTHVANQVVVQWNDAKRPSGGCRIVARVLPAQRVGERIDALLRGRNRQAGLHAGDAAVQNVGTPDRLLRERRRHPAGRRPHVDVGLGAMPWVAER